MSKLGRWQGAGLLATTLLGTSVFILPQITIELAQNNAIVAWLLLTFAIIPVTLVFGHLCGNHPHAAGPANFIEKAFGSIAGKSIGLAFLCAVPLGVPAAILMTYQFIDSIISLSPTGQWIIQLAMLASIFAVNCRGIQVSAKLQLLLTLAIVSVVITLFIFALLDTDLNIAVSTSPINPVLTAASLAFWSFLGIEAMAHLSDEFENPVKDMIPAMLIGTLLVGVIYIMCTLLIIWYPTSQPLAMATIFDELFTVGGNLVIGILGIAGGLATVNVYTASAAKLLSSFSQDGILPSYFLKKNNANFPARALIIILLFMASVITFTYLTGKGLEDLIFWVNGVFILIFLASMLSAYRLLDTKYYWLIHISIIFCLVIIFSLGADMLYACGITVLTSLISYRHYYKKKQGIQYL